MRYLLAMVPILAVLALMIYRRWGAHKAGLAGWVVALLIGGVAFGLTPQVFWISQAKGLLLSFFVLAVMWPALFLYHWIDQNGGVRAVAALIEGAIPNKGMCQVLLAWALCGLLEGLAGFGLPIAVVAPMLVLLRVPPLRAVAAVAVGHSWAATFGDMGIILQTLSAVVGMEVPQYVGWAGLLLGVACLLCGLGAALILGEIRQWPKILALSAIMAASQYALAASGLVPLSAFGAGLAGLLAYLIAARRGTRQKFPAASGSGNTKPGAAAKVLAAPESSAQTKTDLTSAVLTSEAPVAVQLQLPLRGPAMLALGSYGALTFLMATLTLLPALRAWSQAVAWKPQFPAAVCATGFRTAAGPGQVFRPFSHPGSLILVIACLSLAACARSPAAWPNARRAAMATARATGAASLGIIFMVGLSTLMDHCGMTYLLAQGLSRVLGHAYPILSPWVGILGAFATGSNNNSNVLFGLLQKNVAVLLNTRPEVLVAAQTAGGSLGSMLAPAKILVGCSTVGQVGREGQVLRQTVPCGLAIGLAIGLLAFVLSRAR